MAPESKVQHCGFRCLGYPILQTPVSWMVAVDCSEAMEELVTEWKAERSGKFERQLVNASAKLKDELYSIAEKLAVTLIAAFAKGCLEQLVASQTAGPTMEC